MNSEKKSFTPAILGMSSHGAKLPLNMNIKDRENFLTQLNAWREARAEKLTASILAKNRQSINITGNQAKQATQSSSTLTKPKTKLSVAGPVQSSEKKNVFQRLYEDSKRKTFEKNSEGNKMEKPNETKIQLVKDLNPLEGKMKVPKIVICDIEDSDGLMNSDVKDLPEPRSEVENLFEKAESAVENSKEGSVECERCFVKNDTTEKVEKPFKSDDTEQDIVMNSMAVKSAMPKEWKQNKRTVSPYRSMKQKLPLRRSLSTIFRTKKENVVQTIHKAQSETSLESMLGTRNNIGDSSARRDTANENLNEVLKIESCKKGIRKNKSVCFMTPKNKPLSNLHLRNKLETWLTENGHSIDTYRHLSCFGLHSGVTPGTPYRRFPRNEDSSNTSFYSTESISPVKEAVNESNKENTTPQVYPPKVDKKEVEGWLEDLYLLITQLKYPTHRCEELLTAISGKYSICNQLPVYWECRAALGCDRITAGNSKDSSDEKFSVDDSLSQLFQEMKIEEKCSSTSKAIDGLDTKNIIKSKALMFTLREKAIKQLDATSGQETRQKVLVATPVRRSTRIRTPGKSSVVSSLKTLDPDIKEAVSFQPNKSLFTG